MLEVLLFLTVLVLSTCLAMGLVYVLLRFMFESIIYLTNNLILKPRSKKAVVCYEV